MKLEDHFNEEKLPDFLEDLRGENPFQTPHNYFKGLPDQIMQRIQEEKSQSQPDKWWHSLTKILQSTLVPKPVWAIATVLVVGAYFWMNNVNQLNINDLESDFTSVELAQYIQDHIDDFEVSDFYVHDLEDVDILSESMQDAEIEPLLDDLMEDIDLETLQRIL